MRPIVLIIAAGATEAIPIMGRYVRNGDSSPTITVKDEERGDFAILAAGDAVQFDRPYTRLLISHDEATEQTVTINFGFGQILTARTVGTVSVINGELIRSANALSFWGADVGTAAVGEYMHHQLWNPADSGVNLVVNEIMMSSDNNADMTLRFHPAALAGAGPTVYSKMIGAGTSQAELHYLSSAAVVGTRLAAYRLEASTARSLIMTEPLVIPPGYGLLAVCGIEAAQLMTSFQFYEDNI